MTATLEEQKATLQGLKTRVDSIVAMKDGLIREAGTQEQRRDQSLKELVDLGYPNSPTMSVEEMKALSATISVELGEEMASLATTVNDTEALLGVAKSNGLDI
mgnify:CR=1 FL=1